MQRVLIGFAAALVAFGAMGAQQLSLNVPLDHGRGKDWPMREMELPVRPAAPTVVPEAHREPDPGTRKPFQYDVMPDEDDAAPGADDRPQDLLDIRGA